MHKNIFTANYPRRRAIAIAIASAITIMMIIVPVLPAKGAVPDDEINKATQSSCLPGSLDQLKTAFATHPISASIIYPYEGHRSFTSWAESYDILLNNMISLDTSIYSKLEADGHRVNDITKAAYARTLEHDDINSMSALDRVYAEKQMINHDIDVQIETSLEEETAYLARIAPIADLIDTSGWSDDKIDFVLEWGPRNDSYLSGTPLSGYGCYFASSAYDNGIDPRISAAISRIESGCGSACFRPHNAWGWGSSGWASWPEAIEGHASGLSNGYGYDMDASDCARYCPGNGSYYGLLRSEMSQI